MLVIMLIQSICIDNFGGICSYEAELAPQWNLLNSRYCDEIAIVMQLLLCHDPPPVIPDGWLREDTRISAVVCLEDAAYQICVIPQLGQLRLRATDPAGENATEQYRYALSHCKEQDAMEVFNGHDSIVSSRLYRYWCREEDGDLSCRTEGVADTKTFRRYLRQYIQAYRPERINGQKGYQTTISRHGVFRVSAPGSGGKIHLSETEKRLFHYICFLNVAEFWAEFEAIRDLHHEKKPLLIQDFLEFLDAGADISGLIVRTQKLHRQIIILTSPMGEERKKKWTGENNGIFLESCSAVCSL